MIENTSRRDPLLHLAGSMGSPDRYITEMESDGQQQLVDFDRLPTDCRNTDDELTSLGFVLGDIDQNDPMFRHVQLPSGWRRGGSEHAMWSHLMDSNGKKRASIFYKAAFYDRDAHWGLCGVHTYVWDLLHDPKRVLDLDDWATPEAVRDAIESERSRRYDYMQRAKRQGDEKYAEECRGQLTRLDETRPGPNSWWSDTRDGCPRSDEPPTRVWLSPTNGLVVRHDPNASPLPVHWIDEHYLPPADAVELHPCGPLPAWDNTDEVYQRTSGPIHSWMGLSHASHQVLPRVLMQSMPRRWQHAMVALLEEMQQAFAHRRDLTDVDYKVDTVDWTEPGELTAPQRDWLGITVDYGDDDPDAETTYHDRDGRELDAQRACVPVPVRDPLPGYRHAYVEPHHPDGGEP